MDCGKKGTPSASRTPNSATVRTAKPIQNCWRLMRPSKPSNRWVKFIRRDLVPQQFVDRGLGAGLLVDAFDDHRTIEAWRRRAGFGRLAGHGAGHHHRIGRHFALKRLAGLAIDDTSRST